LGHPPHCTGAGVCSAGLRPGDHPRPGHPAGPAHVPQSPRWLFIHGHNEQAEELIGGVERQVEGSIKIRQRRSIDFGQIAHTAFKLYPKRTVLGLSLFIGQAFLYNAVFLTQALVLSTFFKVPDDKVPAYIIPFAFGTCSGRSCSATCRPPPSPPAGWWSSSSPRPGPAPPT
jgi:hypothetical protein